MARSTKPDYARIAQLERELGMTKTNPKLDAIMRASNMVELMQAWQSLRENFTPTEE